LSWNFDLNFVFVFRMLLMSLCKMAYFLKERLKLKNKHQSKHFR